MGYDTLKIAFDDLVADLEAGGFDEKAKELLAFVPPKQQQTQQQQTPAQTNSRFEEQQTPNQSPTQILSQIITHIKGQPAFKNLPRKVIQGLLKVEQLSGVSSRYAFDKDAFFGGDKDPLKNLKKVLDSFYKTDPDTAKLPPEIRSKVDTLSNAVDDAVQTVPKEKGVLEKGMDVARGVAEKGKDIARGVAEKGQQIQKGIADKQQRSEEDKTYKTMKNFEQQQFMSDREQASIKNLKDSLINYKPYKDVFGKLPKQIMQILESIGLGLGDLNNLGTAKVACHVNNTLMHYFSTREAYSSREISMGIKEEKEHADVYDTYTKVLDKKKVKNPLTMEQFAKQVAKAHLKEDPKYYTKLKKTFKESMDFSGIGNLITPDGDLDERELSRVIRLAIAGELDATHLYEIMVDSTNNKMVKKVLQDIADEEKVHASELTELLNMIDTDNPKFVEEGKKEIKSLIKEGV